MGSYELITAVTFTISLLLHVVGFVFLLKIRPSPTLSVNQRLYLLNLSFLEILVSAALLVSGIVQHHYGASESNSSNSPSDLFWKIAQSSTFIWYTSIMTSLTVDRLLEVRLNLKYSVVWTERKTKVMLLLSLMIGVISGCVFALTTQTVEQLNNILVKYVWPSIEWSFLILASITYIYFFMKIRQNEKQDQIRRGSTSSSGSNQRRRTRFFVPFLLIATFSLFWLVPDQAHMLYMLLKPNTLVPEELKVVVRICLAMALISDAFIYIFLLRDVRVKMLKIFQYNLS